MSTKGKTSMTALGTAVNASGLPGQFSALSGLVYNLSSGLGTMGEAGKVSIGKIAAGAGIGLAAIGGVAEQLSSPLDAANAQLAQSLKNAGQSEQQFDPQIARARNKMQALGFTYEDTDQSLSLLVQAFGSGKKAISEEGLVADLAARSHTNLAAQAITVAKAYAKSPMALRQFGINLTDVTAKGKTAAAAQKAALKADQEEAKAKQSLAELEARLNVSVSGKSVTSSNAVLTAQNELAAAGQHLQEVETKLRAGTTNAATAQAELEAAQNRVAAASTKLDTAQSKVNATTGLTVSQSQELANAQQKADAATTAANITNYTAIVTHKDLAKSQITGAQILDMLHKKTQGLALAQSKTFGGDLRKWKAQIVDFGATEGAKLAKPLIALGPALAATGILIETGFFGKIGSGMKSLVTGAANVTKSLLGIGEAAKTSLAETSGAVGKGTSIEQAQAKTGVPPAGSSGPTSTTGLQTAAETLQAAADTLQAAADKLTVSATAEGSSAAALDTSAAGLGTSSGALDTSATGLDTAAARLDVGAGLPVGGGGAGAAERDLTTGAEGAGGAAAASKVGRLGRLAARARRWASTAPLAPVAAVAGIYGAGYEGLKLDRWASARDPGGNIAGALLGQHATVNGRTFVSPQQAAASQAQVKAQARANPALARRQMLSAATEPVGGAHMRSGAARAGWQTEKDLPGVRAAGRGETALTQARNASDRQFGKVFDERQKLGGLRAAGGPQKTETILTRLEAKLATEKSSHASLTSIQNTEHAITAARGHLRDLWTTTVKLNVDVSKERTLDRILTTLYAAPRSVQNAPAPATTSATGAARATATTGANVPHLAAGGIVQPIPGGTLVRVGEAGRPELVAPIGGSGAVAATAGSSTHSTSTSLSSAITKLTTVIATESSKASAHPVPSGVLVGAGVGVGGAAQSVPSAATPARPAAQGPQHVHYHEPVINMNGTTIQAANLSQLKRELEAETRKANFSGHGHGGSDL